MRFFTTILLIFCGLVCLLLFSRCSNTKYLAGNDILLRNNKIEIKQTIHPLNIKEDIHLRKDLEYARQLKQTLLTLCKQKPNTQTVDLFKLNLWFYNKGKFHSDSAHFFVTRWWDGFRTFLGKHLGEEPVIYDSTQTFSTLQLMRNYINNKGYLHAKVTYTTKIKKKRATVQYTVVTGKLYRIDSIYYPSKESKMGDIINISIKNSLLHPGMPYDVDLMKQETDRITTDANNWGYYHFADNYLSFAVDTVTTPGKLFAYLTLQKKPQDSLAYNKFNINNIYVYPDTVAGEAPISLHDTVMPKPHFYIINGDGLLHPKVLVNVVSFHNGDNYSKAENDYTISRISDLNVFKFITIKYKEIGNNLLDCYIFLIPAKHQSVQAEFELNNYTNNPIGNQLSLSYLDKNLFHGADQLNLTLEGGIQLNPFDSLGLLNTVDFNSILNLTFPKFLGPQFINKWFPFRANPKTDFSFDYTYVERLGYFTLGTGTVNLFTWDWHESAFKHHILTPISISILNIDNITAPFDSILVHDPLLAKSYTNLVIIGGNYSFIWSNQVSTTQDKFFYLGIKADYAGNSFYIANKIFSNSSQPPYNTLGLPFANFFKIDLEFRYYYKLFHRNYLVFRFAPGYGVAYWNSTSGELPYTQQFYLGGPNSIRGWQIRSLGPGEYVLPASAGNLLYADQTADIKLEGNVEYRFDIFDALKGAIFTDFGNIWDRVADPDRPGGAFKINSFYKQIAIASGIGLRYDFGFFVIRLDLGIPIYNPALLSTGQPWLTTFKPFNGAWFNKYEVLNFAIGYPF